MGQERGGAADTDRIYRGVEARRSCARRRLRADFRGVGGPGSSGTGPFRPGFSDSEGFEGSPSDSWTAVRAAQGTFSSASGALQRAGHTAPAPASTRLRPVLLALPCRLPGRSLSGLVRRPATVALDVEFEDMGAVDEAVDVTLRDVKRMPHTRTCRIIWVDGDRGDRGQRASLFRCTAKAAGHRAGGGEIRCRAEGSGDRVCIWTTFLPGFMPSQGRLCSVRSFGRPEGNGRGHRAPDGDRAPELREARGKPEVQAVREWILQMGDSEQHDGGAARDSFAHSDDADHRFRQTDRGSQRRSPPRIRTASRPVEGRAPSCRRTGNPVKGSVNGPPNVRHFTRCVRYLSTAGPDHGITARRADRGSPG